MKNRNAMMLQAGLMALCAAATPAWADKASDTLNVAFTKELENVDSYFNSSREGVVLQRAIWDGLIWADPMTGEYKGNLATEWHWADDDTLELKLREGVKFHDGSDFNADDVVATVNFVADPKNGAITQRNVNWMKSAEKVDDFTVRIHTNGPFPAALEFLSGPVSIYPSDYYAKVGPQGMGLKPVGTGPYRVVSVDPGKHFVLEKNPDYHDSPKGQPSIGKIDIRTIPEVNTQIAELFNGGLDFIWEVPADQAERIAQMDRFTVANESTMRVGYLSMDSAGRSGDTPFKKQEVRQAVNHAIDRQALVDNLLKGSSKVIWTACYPSQFGCSQDVPTYPYDPAKARELLAQAGYPDGFTTDFYGYRDQQYAEAIASQLAQVGIKVNLKMLQYSALRDLNMKGSVPFSFQTWGSFSVNDASAMVSEYFKGGDLDDARDEQTIKDLGVADTSTDPETRKEYYAKALTRIAEQAFWAPMFSYNTNYVFSRDVEYAPTADEVLRFVRMTWK